MALSCVLVIPGFLRFQSDFPLRKKFHFLSLPFTVCSFLWTHFCHVRLKFFAWASPALVINLLTCLVLAPIHYFWLKLRPFYETIKGWNIWILKLKCIDVSEKCHHRYCRLVIMSFDFFVNPSAGQVLVSFKMTQMTAIQSIFLVGVSFQRMPFWRQPPNWYAKRIESWGWPEFANSQTLKDRRMQLKRYFGLSTSWVRFLLESVESQSDISLLIGEWMAIF